MTNPQQQAAAWLHSTYGGLVEPATAQPVYETATAWLFACRPLPQPGYPATPMLAASVVVPKGGGSPFHPAPSAPLADLEPVPPQEAAARAQGQDRRINARGCLVALHSAIGGAPSVPLPWRPSDEAPGWWKRLHRRYFPEFGQVPAGDWDDVIKAVAEPGPDTRGVVWVRREIGGQEATGNLLYAHNNKGQVVLLDGLTSSLARLDASGVRELVLLRALPGAGARPPWERAAGDFGSAVAKARLWLDDAYRGQVELAAPTAQDETRRGWVFSCNTKRFLRDGHWQDAMLDATVVVPKDETAPFGLPNADPWNWLARWDAGETPGSPGMPAPPAPGRAPWFAPTLAELGPVMSVSEHPDWQGALGALAALPTGARAVTWVRRTDGRGREAVGWLVIALRTEQGTVLVDGASGEPASLDMTGVERLHVIRYR
ncbi:YrhB domain-containing protein [Streptomyces orinoci]|uniref:YrhB domain-containing protein n=1 Tax=Streptomyces orinoci TaxID=67339 RepID=A0ABV3JXJ5_STRON|nr:YrhB domain-containing protein [Streptomyces orinoci]